MPLNYLSFFSVVVYHSLSEIYLIIMLKFVSGTYTLIHYSQEEGVPQGSIFSVTLFSLKMHSIVSCLLPDIKCSLYVYDFAIYYSSSQMPSIEKSYNTVAGMMRMVLS